MIETLWTWVTQHQALLAWIAGASALVCLASILCLPLLVALIPEDYFTDERRHRPRIRRLHPAVYFGARLLKNMIGWTLVLAGILMLVLPGQGLLTILMGLILSDFPGKYRVERKVAGNARIMGALNWMRERVRHPPLKPPSTTTQDGVGP